MIKLQVQSDYLESYLVHKCSDPESPTLLTFMDLLCKYYEKTNRYAEAAELLSRLADIDKLVTYIFYTYILFKKYCFYGNVFFTFYPKINKYVKYCTSRKYNRKIL